MVISEYITKQGYFKLNKKPFSRSEIMFTAAFAMFMFSTLYGTTMWGFWDDAFEQKVLVLTKLMRYGCYGICVLKFLIDAYYERSRLLIFGIALGILLVGYFGCHNTTLVLYSTMFLAVEDVSSEWIVKVALFCQSVIFIFTVGLSQIGVIEDIVWEANIRPRHFTGFGWVTTSSILFLFMLFEYIYLKKGRINIAEYTVGIAMSYWLYKMSDARMTFIVSFLTLTFFFLFKKIITKAKLIKKIRGILCCIPFLLAVISIMFQYIYNPDNPVLAKVNELLTGRLKLGHNGIEKYGFSLLGKKIEWIGYSTNWKSGMEYNYIDSSYLQTALEYGVLVLLLILVLYAILINASIQNGEYVLCWIVIIILLFCVTEPRIVKLAFNPFLLLAVTESRRLFLKDQENYRKDNEKRKIINS